MLSFTWFPLHNIIVVFWLGLFLHSFVIPMIAHTTGMNHLKKKEPIYMHNKCRRQCTTSARLYTSADYFVVYGCRVDHVAGPLCEGIDPLRAFQQSLQWLTLLYILFPFSYQRPPNPLFTCRQRPPKMFILVWWNRNMIMGIQWNWVKENESVHSTCFLSVWRRSNGFRETILKIVNFIFCYEN
jgi:hypothetical protein